MLYKKAVNSQSVGHHKYRSNTNKVVSTAKEAQEYLDKLTSNKKWDAYEWNVGGVERS